MRSQNFLTDEELDELCPGTPTFDAEAVKRRVLARTAAQAMEKRSEAKKPHPVWKGLLLSAAICILSVSCLAMADLASGGRISMALGIAPAAKVETVAEAAEERPPEPAKMQPPEPETEKTEEKAAPTGGELGSEFTDAFAFTPAQTTLLRPAVQNVNQTAVNQEIQMTVLQTLGDARYLYITVRFDFPEAVPVDTTYTFQDMNFSVKDGFVHAWDAAVVDCSAHSVTYLISARSEGLLNGQRVTLSYEDYGHSQILPDGADTVACLPGGKTTIIGTGGDAAAPVGSAETDAAAPVEVSREDFPEDGCSITRWSDGSSTVTCDGTKGERWLLIGEGEPASIAICTQDPAFETLCEGTWEQSWTLSYQDLSKSWSGAQSIYDPALILSSLRISPLSWSMECTGVLDANDPDAAIPYVRDIDVELVMADGSVQKFPLHLSAWSSHTEETGEFRAVTETKFSSPIDLTDAIAVILDGITLPLGS